MINPDLIPNKKIRDSRVQEILRAPESITKKCKDGEEETISRTFL